MRYTSDPNTNPPSLGVYIFTDGILTGVFIWGQKPSDGVEHIGNSYIRFIPENF